MHTTLPENFSHWSVKVFWGGNGWPRLALNLQSSCLSLLSAGITYMSHHAQFQVFFDATNIS
jgi:hypothetical protein